MHEEAFPFKGWYFADLGHPLRKLRKKENLTLADPKRNLKENNGIIIDQQTKPENA